MWNVADYLCLHKNISCWCFFLATSLETNFCGPHFHGVLSWCPKQSCHSLMTSCKLQGTVFFTKCTAGNCITCLLACSPDMNIYLHHHQVSPRNEALFIVCSDLMGSSSWLWKLHISFVPCPRGDCARVTHPASFLTALPLSTAGGFRIHERAESLGLRTNGGMSCRNISWVFELIIVVCMANLFNDIYSWLWRNQP